ncbi:hypothetical protein KGM_213712 [Danaus plexippus plexippus]|uniref:Uncharacterized protein n=1 Tax=Danaus plexippus plexippus TaxID=278856 RepID=A0A212EWL9_DANPL|nr:hypothetical protein KGM_213712 [Danaus plexippus plexippus]
MAAIQVCEYKYADIEKMFRQTSPLAQCYKKIIWRRGRNQQMKEY